MKLKYPPNSFHGRQQLTLNPPKEKTARDNIFVVNDYKTLTYLKGFLQSRKYNTFVESKDKKGNPLIGLIWDYKLGMFPSPSRGKRGLIVITNREFLKPALLNTLNHMDIESEYGLQWRKAQADLINYARDFREGFTIEDRLS